MPEDQGKIPGHVALERAADTILNAPLGRLTNQQKNDLHRELLVQVWARRNDVIPAEVRTEVVAGVIKALALVAEELPNFAADFAASNLLCGWEDLKQILTRLDERWVIYTVDCLPMGRRYVVTEKRYECLVREMKGDPAQTLADDILRCFCPPFRIAPRLLWSPPNPTLEDVSATEEAADDHLSCPECQGKGKYISVLSDGSEGHIRCRTCDGRGWVSREEHERLAN